MKLDISKEDRKKFDLAELECLAGKKVTQGDLDSVYDYISKVCVYSYIGSEENLKKRDESLATFRKVSDKIEEKHKFLSEFLNRQYTYFLDLLKESNSPNSLPDDIPDNFRQNLIVLFKQEVEYSESKIERIKTIISNDLEITLLDVNPSNNQNVQSNILELREDPGSSPKYPREINRQGQDQDSELFSMEL